VEFGKGGALRWLHAIDAGFMCKFWRCNRTAFDRPNFSAHPELLIEYLSTSVRESLIGISIIHIEQLQFVYPSMYKLFISPSDERNLTFTRSLTTNSSEIHGIGFSVPSIGNYSNYSNRELFGFVRIVVSI
jgi:hypothetical protein